MQVKKRWGSLNLASLCGRSVVYRLFLFFTLFLSTYTLFGHSTQVAYCIINGNVRVYIQHYHGNVVDFSDASVSISTVVDGGAPNVMPNVPASGFIHDVPLNMLPCDNTIVVIASTDGTPANLSCRNGPIYEDWAYFDFPLPDCFVTLQITVNDIDDPSFVLSPCGGLYPAAADPVTVEDTAAPVPDCTVLTDKLDYDCDEDFPALLDIEDFMVTDDCTSLDDIDLIVNDIIISEASCPLGLPTIQRIYTFIDDYDKQAECIQNLGYKDDDVDPKISCPAAIILECGDDLLDSQIAEWLDSAEAEDDCGGVTITNDFDPSTVVTCNTVRAVVFTATDDCDNSSECRVNLTIRDTQSPEITCPADLTLECGEVNNTAIIQLWLESVELTDNCSNDLILTNNYNELLPAGCNVPTGTRTVTFTGDDQCATSARVSCTSTITVDDTTTPEFLMKPQDVTVECINVNGNAPQLNGWIASNGGGMAQDACDDALTWTRTLLSEEELCGYTRSYTYQFEIEDDCGNSSSTTATFTVIDNTPPNINAPLSRDINCTETADDVIANIVDNVSSTDVCSDIADIDIQWMLFSYKPTCGGAREEVWQYIATDPCGNVSYDYVTFNVADNTIARWEDLPGQLDLQCGDTDNPSLIEEWMEDIDDAVYDECGGAVSVTNNWDGSFLEDCNAANWIEFTVEDACGNSRVFNRRIRLLDQTNPIFLNCPSDMTVNVDVDNCDANVIFSTPIVYDQCSQGLIPTQTLGPASGSSFPLGSSIIRFDVRDNCNRLGRCQFQITVEDSEEPNIDCPSNVEVCAGEGLCYWNSDDSVVPTTVDNCPTLTIQFELSGATTLSRRSGTAANRNLQLGTTEVCYYLTDRAGNETSCCFDVIVSDCEDPMLEVCPENFSIECDGTGNTDDLSAWLATFSATDNCPNLARDNALINTVSNCGDSQTLVYEFVATDAAGNTSRCTSEFNIKDGTAPTIVVEASDGDSNCDNANADLLDWLNNFGYAEATDDCGEVSWSHIFKGGAMTGCSGVTSVDVIFIATDACGNSSKTEASFNVDDTERPSITCPTDIVLECGNVLNDAITELWLLSASGEDNCTEVSITNDYPDGLVLECDDSVIVEFIATDGCDNRSACEATLSIEDTLPPVFIMKPQDITVECDGAGNLAEIAANVAFISGAMYMDECTSNEDMTVDIDEAGDNPGCGVTDVIDYLITLTDDCGNSTDAMWSIYIEDSSAPTVIPPKDITVECDSPATSLSDWQKTASASDDCGDGFSFDAILFNTISACGNTNSEVYQFTATDQCGNQATALASYTFVDNNPPDIECPKPLELVCGNSNNPTNLTTWLQSATGSDTCGDIIISDDFDGELPGNCGKEKVVVFTATDACGLVRDCKSVITLIDEITPEFLNCPEDMTVNVDVDLCGTNPIFSTPVVTDNCDVKVSQTKGNASGSTFPLGDTGIEFTAEDECGNTETCQFTITVVDSDVPLILCPSNDILACVDAGACVWTSDDIGPSLGQENCAGYTIDYAISGATSASGSDDASGEVLALGISTICYTITDASSNTSLCCFDVIVSDCEAPQIICSDVLDVECGDEDLSAWFSDIESTATDNCNGALSVDTLLLTDISSCGATIERLYMYTVTDAAGNSSTCTATYETDDTGIPVIINDVPYATTVECVQENNSADLLGWILNNAGLTTATETCGSYSWMNDYVSDEDIIAECNGVERVFRIDVEFWVVDDCGNESERIEKRWRIEDTTPPELIVPADLTLECNNVNNEAIISTWLEAYNAYDVCDVELVTEYDFELADLPECDEAALTVTWTSTDHCDNVTQSSSTITIEDSTNPEFGVRPQDITIECDDPNMENIIDSWIDRNGDGTASDACGDITWEATAPTAADILANCGNTEVRNYTWTITDDCGNESSSIASVILEDTTVPTLILPSDLTVECDGAGNAEDLVTWLATVDGEDTCGDVNLESELYNTISACGDTDARVYIFTATDDCGNSTTGLSTFTIEDETNPEITCPEPLEIICGGESNDLMINAWLNSASGIDDCGELSYTNDFVGKLPNLSCDVNLLLDVEFTVMDDCGNRATCTSTITRVDEFAPSFSNCPTDLTVNVDTDLCETNVVYSEPIALDNCDENVDVVFTSGIVSGAAFPIGTTTILFTASDDCGNTETCQFDITVLDTDVPSIDCSSNTINVCTDSGACNWESDDQVSAIFNENCADEGYTVTYAVSGATTANSAPAGINDVSDDGVVFMLGESEVCYTIEDAAGNSETCCFTLIVEDCENPTIDCPADLTVECDGAGNTSDLDDWKDDVEGNDNCTVNLTLSDQLFNTISDCNNAKSFVYQFKAIDENDNSVSCMSTFFIEDTTEPMIDADAENLTIECSAGSNGTESLLAWLENNGGALASDVCNDILWSNDYSGIMGACGETGETTVVFTATDDCGNISTTEATFKIEDTTPPAVDCPSNITLECEDLANESIIAIWLLTAQSTDDCSSFDLAHDYADEFVSACGATGVYTVTFTATDACNNVSDCKALIELEDTTSPVIESAATNLLLECADANNATLITDWLDSNGKAVASDVCSDMKWSYTSLDPIATCGKAETTIYIFTVTDECDNTSTTTAQVIINDTTAPELSVPPSLTEECGDIAISVADWLANASSTDDCGSVTIETELLHTINGCGGSYTSTYLFTATDECGNVTSGQSTYIIEDTSDPTVVCPANLALECGNESNDQLILSWLNSATGSDKFDCSDVVVTHTYPGELPSLDCLGSAGLPITFTATDDCGNDHTCESIITMDDPEKPYFANCPLDISVNVDSDLCETNVVYSQPIALDNCDENVEVVRTSGIASGQPFPIGTTTILYTATDNCGNTQTCQFDITVVDSDIPTIDCPSNNVEVCTDDESCSWDSDDQVSAIFNENCADEGYTVTYEITGATTANSALVGVNDIADDDVTFSFGESEVCYTIEDDAGNSATCCFIVIVNDCEPPSIECPEDITVECDGSGNSTELSDWIDTATGSDNCFLNAVVTEQLFNTISDCNNARSFVYEFEAEDNFENTTSCFSTFTIEDTSSPDIDVDAENLTIECTEGSNGTDQLIAWLEDNGRAVASDDCNDLTWSNDFSGITAGCKETGQSTVVFTVTDDCGNTSTTQAIFRIEDNTVPEITCPDDITLECADPLNEAISTNWLNTVESQDACSSVSLTHDYTGSFVGACGDTGEYTVVFTAVDDCGNVSNCNATITIEDTIEPHFDFHPSDLNLECGDLNNDDLFAAWVAENGGGVAHDECSELFWSIHPPATGDTLFFCGGTMRIDYIWRVTDECGNQSTSLSSVIIEDNIPPSVVAPEDITVECDGGGNQIELADWLAEIDGSDVCGGVTFQSQLYSDISDCGGAQQTLYVFTVTDECGHSSTGISSFTIEDTTMPVPTCPADLTINCGDENNDLIILNWLELSSGVDQDDCSQVNISYDIPSSLPDLSCDSSDPISIEFTATDACGNTATCSSMIVLEDIVDPYFSNCPNDLTVNVDVDLCSSNVIFSTPIALDNCDENVEVSQTEGLASGAVFPLGVTAIEFTADDGCGNTTTCSFNITVIDSNIPSIDCPSNDVFQCTDANSCTWLSDDSTDPLFNENCIGLSVSYEITGATTATGNADPVNLVSEDGVVFEIGESKICYTIEDASGNSSSCCFDVIVEDCNNPEITCNDILDVACGAEDVSSWFEGIEMTATDNCLGDLTVDTLLLTDFSSCGNTFNRTYIYTVTDLAGNSSSCVATYSTSDNVNPTITDAVNLTIECSLNDASLALQAWLNNNGGATATDACSEPIIWTNNFTGDISDGCASSGQRTVIFTATDDCGNQSSTTAMFIIEDNTPPILEIPDAITLECEGQFNDAIIENWTNSATAYDLCSGSIIVTNDFDADFVGACGLTGTYTVTFTAIDDCGNETVDAATITIEDTSAPQITNATQDLQLECADPNNEASIALWLLGNGHATAADACSDDDLIWSSAVDYELQGCGNSNTTKYIFTVTDNCGHTSTTSASVIISDSTPPTIDVLPETQLLECFPSGNEMALISWLNNQGGAVASDDCSATLTWEYDLVNVAYSCADNGTRTYRFTVTDECGNSSFAEADFELVDTTPPSITKQSEPITVECDGSTNGAEIIAWLNNNGYAEAEDICGRVTWTNDYGTVAADCGTTGGVTVNFVATDECGNTSETSALFLINDTTDPVWEILPQDLVVECNGTDDPMKRIEGWLNTAGGGEGEDGCSLVTYSNDFNAIDLECSMEGGVEVKFTITDACGNFTEAFANLSVTDDVAPVILSPAKNTTVECDGYGNPLQLLDWLNNNGGAEAEDLCSPTITWDYTLMSTTDNCGGTETHTYMFTATDACDNVSANTIADFIIEDRTSPTFSSPPTDLTVECDGTGNDIDLEYWLQSNASGTAEDICSDNISWTYDLVMDEDSCGISGIQVFRFTITDECGNENHAEATFVIEDTTDPIIVDGEDMLLEECESGGFGNFAEFDFWLNNNAGATASDLCGGEISWTNDFHPDNWMTVCGNTQRVDVIFTATDECGNESTVSHAFGYGDVTPPVFEHCPKPPIVVDAPDSWCSSYVNFEQPTAQDNCGEVTIEKTDNTNLDSGDLFPVGTTILTYVATDDCGNSTYCELIVSVNDFHTPPTITCPESVTVMADNKTCGAVVNNIAPASWEDNCPDNVTILYEITDNNGVTLACGFEDASGFSFPVGTSNVEYTIIDQPLLFITEFVQDGTSAQLEISNLGPGTLDISNLDIVREGTAPETYNVPNGTLLPVGQVYVQNFTAINGTAPASYYLEFLGRVIDGVSLNGHNTTAFNFSGSVNASNALRTWVCDHNNADDFIGASSCFEGSIGVFNEQLVANSDNGSTVGLQEGIPSMESCSFEVSVIDEEAPFCAQYDTTSYCITAPLSILPEQCTAIPLSVPPGITAHDVKIKNINIAIDDASDLSLYLTSPDGHTIYLFGQLCSGTSDISIELDDHSPNALSTVTCGPLGDGITYQPIGDFYDFYNQDAGGIWTLNISNSGLTQGTIQTACLEILELVPYAQLDVQINNDAGACGAEYMWPHPISSDNCGLASMTISFESDDNLSTPPFGDVRQGEAHAAFFEVGMTTVIYTMTDNAGNKSQCSFDISVIDSELPTINPADCQDQVIQLGPHDCTVPIGAVNLPQVMDNCGSENLANNVDLEGMLQGFHEVSYFYIDEFGNSAECTFNITVLPFIPDNDQLSCIGEVNLSLGPDCMEMITADMILVPGAEYGCTDDFCVTLKDEYGNEIGNSTDGTNLVDESHIGQLITVEVCFDCQGGNCCWGYLNVENKLIPEVVCPKDTVIMCNQIFEPEIVGRPVVETCEQEVYFSYQDGLTRFDMCDDTTAVLERHWYITDESDNVIECLQKISVIGFDISTIQIPNDTIITNTVTCEDVSFDASYTHPDSTGWASFGGVPVFETGDGLCSHFWNYEDQILRNCEGSYEIIRKWIIRDMCDPIDSDTNPLLEKYQSIKVLDDMPPVFENCPTDITVSSFAYDCSADIFLNDYMPSIRELCGSIKDTLVSVTPGTVTEREKGQYYLTNLSAGSHVVKITVRDQCSNYSRCTFNVHVVDTHGPNIICDQDLHVSLSSTGIADLRAEIFDDGSFDNCTALDYQVYRLENACGDMYDTIPGKSIKVCCTDVENSPVMVMLKVWDDADGNQVWGSAGDFFSECMVRVHVSDFPLQNFSCPPDVTLECGQDYNNINLTGAPSNTSICNYAEATFQDEVTSLSDCNTGSVLRTWTIDGTGQQCKQTITLQAAAPFTEANIMWPPNYEGDCSNGLPQLEPSVDLLGCSLVGYTVVSDTFSFVEDACLKIINEWTVIDWCQRSADATPSDTTGRWTHTQVIKITESNGPEILGCDPVIVPITTTDCIIPELILSNSAIDNSCGIRQDVDWTYQVDLDGDGQFEIEGSEQTDNPEVILNNIPGGNITVIWNAFDGCGNNAACTQEVSIEDGKDPTAYCYNLTTAIMETNGQVELWISDFDAGSNDNCTATEDLVISFLQNSVVTNMTYTCDDIPNGVSQIVPVELWVTDEAGNQSICTTSVELQDNSDACLDNSNNQMAVVGGHIFTENLVPVTEVETYINDAQNIDEMYMTESDGIYAFDDVPMNSSYHIKPQKDNGWLNGVSTLDLILMQNHILGKEELGSPYKIIASDVDGDQLITALDVIALRQLILGAKDEIETNDSWRFVEENYVFPDPLYPFPFREKITTYGEQDMDMENDFIGVKIGDVNNTVISNLDEESIDSRSSYDLLYSLPIETHEKKAIIPVFTNEDGLIYGFQLSLKIEGAIVHGLLPGSADISEDNYIVNGEKDIKLSWHSVEGTVSGLSTPIFYLDVTLIDSDSEVVVISDKLNAEIYLGDNYLTKTPLLSLMGNQEFSDLILYQNEPNPFIDYTVIKVFVPEAQEVKLDIYESSGKVLYSIIKDLEKGEHAFDISSEEVGAAGLLYYRLTSEKYSDSKKMMIIK